MRASAWQAARAGRELILALIVAVPIMLAAPAAGQTPGATPLDTAPVAQEPDRFDPDCPEDAAALADPTFIVDPELVDKPDGVCPPDTETDPPAGEPEGEQEASPPADGTETAPPPPGDAPDSQSPDPAHEPAPEPAPEIVTPGPAVGEAPAGVGPAPPEADTQDSAPHAEHPLHRRTHGGAAAPRDGAHSKDNTARANGPLPASGGGVTSPFGGHLADSLLGPTALPSAPAFVARGSSVPRFLRGIYQAAEARYEVRWEILAAINEVETAFGKNLNISSAGAVGWMQFMPATWRAYGTDANDDGARDPYDPEDAIFSAARYLEASGYADDVRGALFAYNHAGWYVEDVLERARRIAAENVSLPAARRLDPGFAHRLARVSERAGVRWELVLAVLRVRGMDNDVPATRAELRTLARRLVRLGAREDTRSALRRLAKATPTGAAVGPRLLEREPAFAERVATLAHYNRAVGLRGLVDGLGAVKKDLERRVLADRRLRIYPGGRADIWRGVTDVRVLLLLRYLSNRYSEVTVTSLTSGHSVLTASGNVSAHSYGRAVDIAALDGRAILGRQEPGGITEQALWRMLLLPAELEPKQLISLFELGGASFALADHADHIHAGY